MNPSRASGATLSMTLPNVLLNGFPKLLRLAMADPPRAPVVRWSGQAAADRAAGLAGAGAAGGGGRGGRVGRGGGGGCGELELGQLVDLGGQLGQGGLEGRDLGLRGGDRVA